MYKDEQMKTVVCTDFFFKKESKERTIIVHRSEDLREVFFSFMYEKRRTYYIGMYTVQYFSYKREAKNQEHSSFMERRFNMFLALYK